MSREIPKTEYIVTITKFGNGAKMKAYKKHIGKKAKITIITEEKNTNYNSDLEDSAGSKGWKKV